MAVTFNVIDCDERAVELIDLFVPVYIESTGALKPDILLLEAAKILSLKCQKFLSELETEN